MKKNRRNKRREDKWTNKETLWDERKTVDNWKRILKEKINELKNLEKQTLYILL